MTRCEKFANDSLTRSVWHRMLYSCTHMATVGVRGFSFHNYLTLLGQCITIGCWGTSSFYAYPWLNHVVETPSRSIKP